MNFTRIYESKDLARLERFHQELDVIAEGYRAQAVADRGNLVTAKENL